MLDNFSNDTLNKNKKIKKNYISIFTYHPSSPTFLCVKQYWDICKILKTAINIFFSLPHISVMSATTKSLQVYENANKGLLTLTELWETMLKIIRSVSTASGSSLTVEPDLVALQKSRQDLESLLRTLRSTTNWLETNELPEKNKAEETESKEYIELMKENKMAAEVYIINCKMIT